MNTFLLFYEDCFYSFYNSRQCLEFIDKNNIQDPIWAMYKETVKNESYTRSKLMFASNMWNELILKPLKNDN